VALQYTFSALPVIDRRQKTTRGANLGVITPAISVEHPIGKARLIGLCCAAGKCGFIADALGKGRGLERSLSIVNRSWVEFVKLAAGLGAVYFLAARLSYFLRAEPDVAVFWPAAGIAVGALIALGPKARLPIATGAFIAIVALNLVFGRNPWLTIAFSLISAGHPLLTAWLIDCWFGFPFKLEDMWRALGFFTATAIGAAIAAVSATAAIKLVEPTVSPLYIWCLWFASASLGVVTVAPLLIGLADADRERVPRYDLIEGSAGLVAITALTAALISLPDGPWATALPEVLVFPLLLWIAIRCQPIFAAGAALAVGLTVIGSTTLNIGYFDWGRPQTDRILSAQIFVLSEAILAVLLAAIFAERRRTAAVLEDSKASLADALAAGQVIAFEWNALSGYVRRSENASLILGDDQIGTEFRRSGFLSRVHPEDRQCFRTLIRELRPRRPSYALTFRYMRPDGQQLWLEETARGEFEATGRLLRIKGLIRDISEQKRTEQALAERNTQLELASKAARVGSFVIDFSTGLVTLSPGCASIMGLPEHTIEMSREDFRKLVHPEDLVQFDAARDEVFLKKQVEFDAQFRIVRADDGEVRWIEARSMIVYGKDGQPFRIIAVLIDFTDRRLADQALSERNAQLALAGRAARVGRYAYDVNTGKLQISEGYAAIHGLPEGTNETTISEFLARVHPEDRTREEAFRNQMFAEKRSESTIEYRIVRSDGEVRWIERRNSVSYDIDGHPKRVVGVSIDVTERKRAEERQLILLAELDHRVKNTLATVSSVVSQTAGGRTSVANFVKALDGRLRSMATTHGLLSFGRWQGVSLTELVRQELAPYATRHNTMVNGPEVVLCPEAGQAMAMVLHELATNAAKYGALSTKQGRVSVRWKRQLNGHPLRLVLEWQEFDGPQVVAPGRAGFGTSTIRDLIPYEFGGSVDLAFFSTGVQCRLELPANWLTRSNEAAA
jgi:PAS domain S-box-containing protein